MLDFLFQVFVHVCFKHAKAKGRGGLSVAAARQLFGILRTSRPRLEYTSLLPEQSAHLWEPLSYFCDDLKMMISVWWAALGLWQ